MDLIELLVPLEALFSARLTLCRSRVFYILRQRSCSCVTVRALNFCMKNDLDEEMILFNLSSIGPTKR